MDIVFKGKYKALSSFEWKDIPSLSIVSGINGAGKSQLLELINRGYSSIAENNLTENKYKTDEFELEIKEMSFSRLSSVYWRSNGLNVSIGYGKFGHEDLEFLVDFINAKISGNHSKIEELSKQPKNEDGNNGKAKFRGQLNYIAEEIIREIELRSGKERHDIIGEDIACYFPEEILLKNHDLFSHDSLEMVFYFYMHRKHVKEHLGKEIQLSEDAPWEILNNVLEESNLPYRVTFPDAEELEQIYKNPFNKISARRFQIKLINPFTGNEIDFYSISSGEKVIFSLALLLYYIENRGVNKKLLLLDEPDAHLHPSFTKKFFDVIYNVVIKKHKGNVILTTHSPSTIAMAPKVADCKIFKIDKSPTEIVEVNDRYEIISLLTDGLILVSPSTKYIIVEGKYDKPFYQSIYELLIKVNEIKKNPSLVFIPGKNKHSVTEWTKGLRDEGNLDFHGIIDLDYGNKGDSFIRIIERYSIENYLLDPINVFVTTSKKPEDLSSIKIDKGDEGDVANLPSESLQLISTSILKKIEASIDDLKPEEKKLLEVEYIGGKKIMLPLWFLKRRGKDLLSVFQNYYGGPSAINYKSLEVNLRRTKLIPVEIKDLFKSIIDS